MRPGLRTVLEGAPVLLAILALVLYTAAQLAHKPHYILDITPEGQDALMWMAAGGVRDRLRRRQDARAEQVLVAVTARRLSPPANP